MYVLTDYARLHHQLLRDYDPDVPPFGNGSEPLLVKFGLSLMNMDLDSYGNLFTHAWLNIEFTDYRLMWDPEEFGGIMSIRLDASKMWLPDITLYNRFS